MLLSDALLVKIILIHKNSFILLQERQGQVEINQRKDQLNKEVDKRYHEILLENIKEEEFIEKEKLREEQEKKERTKQIIKEQHDEHKAKLIKRIQEDKIEGEIIKRKDIEAHEEQLYFYYYFFNLFLFYRAKEREIRMKCIINNEETKKGNEILKEIKAKIKEKEKEEDRKIEMFAKKKDEVIQMRKMREEIKFRFFF